MHSTVSNEFIVAMTCIHMYLCLDTSGYIHASIHASSVDGRDLTYTSQECTDVQSPVIAWIMEVI